MLPFDNKSEFQVIVDMPEGTSIEHTGRVLDALAEIVEGIPEVTDYQVYAGTASPINFNGLVRQYYLRSGSNVGDIQVNLVDKKHRKRSSHEIARAVRDELAAVAAEHGASVKIAEVPPGPPVMAPLVAEIYGPDYERQKALGRELEAMFQSTPDIVDVDSSVESDASRFVIDVDRQRAAMLGVPQQRVAAILQMALAGEDVTYVRQARERYPIPVRLDVPVSSKADLDSLLALEVRSMSGQRVPISEIANVRETGWDDAVYHKDMLPVVFVTADMAGRLDSPLYGMFDLSGQISDLGVDDTDVEQRYISQPDNPYYFSMKWDGEWLITYVSFR
jgi:multidrug efflux pump subunit AcrB